MLIGNVPALHPFQLNVPQEVLTDLQRRLDAVRWPRAAPGQPWQWGADLGFMQSLVTYWRNHFDWRHWEARLNAFPQFLARAGGLDVHVLVAEGAGPHPLPLILTHGWPGSIFELLELVEPLTHPERHGGSIDDAFTVVLPSLPGFGLSPPPHELISPQQIALAWHELMSDVLGFDRFVAHGGDTGATVVSWMGLDRKPSLSAIHLNTPVLFADWTLPAQAVDAEEAAYLERQRARLRGEDAYQHLHAEKPATLSFALADSPVGLAAWIAEKFHGWTSPGAPGLQAVRLDAILVNTMVYWCGASHPVHWQYQSLRDLTGYRLPAGRRVETPTGFCLFPRDIVVPPPRRWLERAYHVADITLAPEGGHFPALENVELLVQDLRAYFRRFR